MLHQKLFSGLVLLPMIAAGLDCRSILRATCLLRAGGVQNLRIFPHLYRIDDTNGSILEVVGNTEHYYISDIDFAPDGTLYGSHWDEGGALISIDPATATTVIIGHFGDRAVPHQFQEKLQNGGLSVDPVTGDIWAVESGFSRAPSIFRVDPATGLAIPPIVRLGRYGRTILFGFDGLEILPNGRFLATRGRRNNFEGAGIWEINPFPDPVSGLAEVSLISRPMIRIILL